MYVQYTIFFNVHITKKTCLFEDNNAMYTYAWNNPKTKLETRF